MVLGKFPPRKIAHPPLPTPNLNANPYPNPDPDRGAIFIGGNFPDTKFYMLSGPESMLNASFEMKKLIYRQSQFK